MRSGCTSGWAHRPGHLARDLGPAGARASRNALLELADGLVLDHFDDREPTFTPVLAQAVKGLADARLTDAELSPSATAAQRRRIRPGLTALDLAQR